MDDIVKDLLAGSQREAGSVEVMLRTAEWAASALSRFRHAEVLAIAAAASEAGFRAAGSLADLAVRETGFGVAADKKTKNEIASRGLFQHYKDDDFCSPRVRTDAKMVELPRPAGVVLGLVPSTNPVCTTFCKIMLAIFSRNAIVISPHPRARQCTIDAVRIMAQAATEAGAPTGAIQVIEDPSVSVIDYAMKSPRIGVTLATGGLPMVRAAYSSGNPAIGVGPGNAPVLVDASADLEAAASRIVASKSFDNSTLCTNESAIVAEEAIADRLLAILGRSGVHVASAADVEKLRAYLFGSGSFNIDALGRPAAEIANAAGFRVSPSTRIIVVPIERVGVEEPLSREKLCPVLGFVRAPCFEDAVRMSAAMIRMSGAGHSAAIHTRAPANVVAFASAVEALRVVVNAPCSQGAAGFATHLAPSFTVGTGFVGRSSIGENIGPQHLVNWTRIAYNREESEVLPEFGVLEPAGRGGAVSGREAPFSLGALRAGAQPAAPAQSADAVTVHDEIRRIVLEELGRALRK